MENAGIVSQFSQALMLPISYKSLFWVQQLLGFLPPFFRYAWIKLLSFFLHLRLKKAYFADVLYF